MSTQTEITLPPEYETLHTGIMLYDPETGGVLDANERSESLFGYSTAKLRELSVERYSANTYPFTPADFIDRLQASAAGDPQRFRWRIKRADGELIWVQIHCSAQTLDSQRCVRAEFRDITEHYNSSHREELFWRVLRHNLRNEANALVGYSEVIEHDAECERVADVAETMKSTAMELGEITESVKQIQHAVNQTDARQVRRDATSAVRAVIDDLEAEYPSAEITLTERARMWIEIDTAFRYALSEALENAVVHSENDCPEVTVTIGPSPNTGRVEIRIEDTNPPIPDAEFDSLFNRDAVTSTSHGTGVGLFVVKWCVESLGGEIRLERHDPRGNTLVFYLPPKESPTEPERQ
ncbi:sensor histidine kinase [Halovenus sp. HT40]|uniref:sensor histidine kinase n=1 Tax=Halovenus sp. HT40 TaxID=3126691 RepID=UPI00300EE2BA